MPIGAKSIWVVPCASADDAYAARDAIAALLEYPKGATQTGGGVHAKPIDAVTYYHTYVRENADTHQHGYTWDDTVETLDGQTWDDVTIDTSGRIYVDMHTWNQDL